MLAFGVTSPPPSPKIKHYFLNYIIHTSNYNGDVLLYSTYDLCKDGTKIDVKLTIPWGSELKLGGLYHVYRRNA